MTPLFFHNSKILSEIIALFTRQKYKKIFIPQILFTLQEK